jgi:hypothetical protein
MATSPVDIEEKEQAMDFFHELDQGRYGAFKMSLLNGWAAGAFDPPDIVNKIYQTAGSWAKLVPWGEGGMAVSYVTIEEGASETSSCQVETRATIETEKGISSHSSRVCQRRRRQETTTKGPLNL